jgi:diadenosine tetraphosphate (Ap4A) HIT family hydrolase
LYHLDDESRRAYYDEMCDVASTIARVFNPRKMNYELLGNQVPHLHWHLFPRYSDDPDFLKPVWLAIGRADDDPLEKRRLETGRLDRADILSRLQAEFQRPRATQ